MEEFLLFVFASIGMAHIVVDGSILEPFRNLMKKLAEKFNSPKIGEVVECYMCSGTWSGFIMGYVIYGYQLNNVFLCLLTVFACGCAGGFLSNFAAILMNYIESATIVNMPEQNKE